MPLTQNVRVKTAGFTFRAPKGATVTQPDEGTSRIVASLRMRQGRPPASFLVERVYDVPADPVKAMRVARDPYGQPITLLTLHRTEVGGVPAAVATYDVGTTPVREYRVLRDGVMYSVVFFATRKDTVAFHTGDAMVASWRWI